MLTALEILRNAPQRVIENFQPLLFRRRYRSHKQTYLMAAGCPNDASGVDRSSFQNTSNKFEVKQSATTQATARR